MREYRNKIQKLGDIMPKNISTMIALCINLSYLPWAQAQACRPETVKYIEGQIEFFKQEIEEFKISAQFYTKKAIISQAQASDFRSAGKRFRADTADQEAQRNRQWAHIYEMDVEHDRGVIKSWKTQLGKCRSERF